MGVTNSSSHKGGFLIDLDKPYYYPGEIVYGKIYSCFQEPFDCVAVEIEISGEEFVSFEEKKHKKSNLKETYMKKRYGRRTLHKSSQILFRPYNNLINQGHYIYPFSFILPLNLPGSFEYYSKDYSAYVRYTLELKAIPFQKEVEPIKDQMVVVIRQPPTHFQYLSKVSDSKPIETCCCIGKGVSTVSLQIERNYCCLDEEVNLTCEFDNSQCRAQGKRLDLALFQIISVKDKKDRKRVLIRKLNEYSYSDRYKELQETSRILRITVKDNHNPVRGFEEKCEHNHLYKDVNLVSLLQATTDSSLISCKYFFRVSTVYDTSMSSKPTPSFEIPIIIYIPDIRPNIQLFQPPNWNPQIMTSIDISFPSFEEGKVSLRNNRLSEYTASDYYNNSQGTGSEGQKLSNPLVKMKSGETLGQKSSKDRLNQSNVKIIEEYVNSNETDVHLKIDAFLQHDNN